MKYVFGFEADLALKKLMSSLWNLLLAFLQTWPGMKDELADIIQPQDLKELCSVLVVYSGEACPNSEEQLSLPFPSQPLFDKALINVGGDLAKLEPGRVFY